MDGKRARKSGDETRVDILDAAERVFMRAMPDTVGLKEIAAEAGVSHGLVTHYFGTYEGLVEATLERRIATARNDALARLVSASFGAQNEWPLLGVLIDSVQDPLTARLVTWAMLSGRSQAGDAFSVKSRGLKLIVDGIALRLSGLMGERAPARERIEFTVVAAIAMTLGFAVAGNHMSQALGRESPLELGALAGEIHAMLRAYLLAPPRAGA